MSFTFSKMFPIVNDNTEYELLALEPPLTWKNATWFQVVSAVENPVVPLDLKVFNP